MPREKPLDIARMVCHKALVHAWEPGWRKWWLHLEMVPEFQSCSSIEHRGLGWCMLILPAPLPGFSLVTQPFSIPFVLENGEGVEG